ncbi:hypothetical protein [Streptomyces sp. NPDC056069]|uniref:hypothetical protein n=1 Tax=Streptomyces sp. NPDC056069 TaxID=3345702 RepID=UPI0035E19DFB
MAPLFLPSPNTVLANALTAVEDVFAPRIHANRPKAIEFTVGTQINGVPHIGTSLVQALAFALAARARTSYGIPTRVVFGALDNAPHEVVNDPDSGHRYQRAIAQAIGPEAAARHVADLYAPLFRDLSAVTGVPYRVETYSTQQEQQHWRETWLRVLPRVQAARWYLAPSTGIPHVRIPCPAQGCGWAEKYAERTVLVKRTATRATFTAVCLHHGEYEVTIRPEAAGTYLDLATLYRNMVKELATVRETPDTMHVMVKGGDWAFGALQVDGALHAVGGPPKRLPMRVYCPQIVTDTGAKLSKSLIREGKAELPPGCAPWMLDSRQWPGLISDYASTLAAAATVLLSDPRHFFRSYSTSEVARVFTP